MHVRLLHLHVVQAHDGIQLDVVLIGILAHDLAMHLAVGRNVDDDVGFDPRGA